MPDDAVVIDSSVWASALQFGGAPRRALDVAAQHHRIVSCAYIRSEVERTLISKFSWTAARVRNEMLQRLGNEPDVVLPNRLRNVCRDPNDDSILECAIVNRAQFILSGDRDLLVLHPFAGIDILSPRQYLDRLATG